MATFNTDDSSIFNRVKDFLPEGYEYRFTKPPIFLTPSNFNAVIRTTIYDEETAKQWVEKFQDKTKVTWRYLSGKIAKGKANVYKRYFRCHHNTLPRSETADCRRGSKNTNCPANMIATVKRTEFKKKKSRAAVPDPYLPDYPCQIEIFGNHNHQIHSADSLRERDVSEETQKKLQELFKKSHSPSSALETIKTDMQISEGHNYPFAAADRADCPDLGYCFRLYYKIFAASYGAPSGEQMVKDLDNHITEFNSEKGEDCARVTTLGKDLVVAVCTPLMKRAHSMIEQSGELVFIDASGGVDRHHCRVFLLLTHSCAGGVPLGCFITTSESREIIAAGLKLLKEILPSEAFYGRGNDGPQVFLSDDSSAERGAIRDVYPNATLLLCTFHLLQANWRYLWEAKNGIGKQDRPHLLNLLKAMVYAKDTDALQLTYDIAIEDSTAKKYNNYLKHLQGIYNRRNEWAVCLRDNLPVRGNHTNNYVEAAMKILKDKVFVRTRAFNVVQLLDFILTRFEAYYERRFIDVANNRLDMHLSKRFLPRDVKIAADSITKITDTVYSVCSQTDNNTKYFVDTSLCMCTCFVGNTGAPCKHQHAVVKHHDVNSVNFVPVDSPFLREQLYRLATGCHNFPEGWFNSLRQVSSSLDMPEDTEQSSGNLPVADGNDEEDEPLTSWSLNQLTGSANEALKQSSETSVIIDTNDIDNSVCLITEQIMQAAASICQRVKSNDSLVASAKQFVSMFNNMHTDSALDSALACFGKYASVNPKSRHTMLLHGTKIPVQPAAIARRSTALGGRHPLRSGRRPIHSKCPMKDSFLRSVVPRSKKAPHSLSKCVQKNQSIGQTHSAK